MPYSLGIDVGTTFTAAAIWVDGRVEVVSLESHRVAVPSVVFANGDELLFGSAAAARGATDPSGAAREFKRRLGDSVPLVLSGAPYSADRLVARFAEWVVATVSDQRGEAPQRVVITHPANWTEFQIHLLKNALDQVGLGGAAFVTEPQAAAIDFGGAAHLDPGDLVVVYDLGGGTFDVAMLRRARIGFEHVGEPAGVERLGGIDFDEAVYQRVTSAVPDEVLVESRSEPTGRMALLQLRRSCVDAKEQLSEDVAADIAVVLPGATTTVRVTRGEFEEMIRPMLQQTIEAVRHVLDSSGVNPTDLSAVLLVGGSSRIPAVSELVRAELGVPVRIDAHPKLVVARGAARWAGTRPLASTPADPSSERPSRRVVLAAVGGALAIAAGSIALFTATRDTQSGEEPPPAASTTAAPTPTSTLTSTTTAPPTTTTDATSTTTAPVESAGQISFGVWGSGGSFLSLGRDDGTVRLVEVESGDQLFERRGHTDAVRRMSFGRDGRLATASADGTVRVWDTDGSSVVLSGHEGAVNYVVWDRDGAQVATGSADGTARVWNPDSGELLQTFTGDGTSVTRVAWSADASTLAIVTGDEVVIWDSGTREIQSTLVGHTDTITDHDFDADGEVLVTASRDGTARVWNSVTGDAGHVLTGHTGPIVEMRWMTGAREQVSTASLDGTVRVWNASSGELVESFGDDGDPAVTSFAWQPGGERVATGGADGVVRLWDLASGEQIGSLAGHSSAVVRMSWSGEDQILAIAEDGTARVFDATTLDEIETITE